MRVLKKNKRQFEYYANLGQEEVIDGGKHTGRYHIVYDSPVIYYGNIAPSMQYDRADKRWYGVEETYIHVIVMDDMNADIKVNGKVVFEGNEYEVAEVAPSINVLRVVIRQIPKNNAAG